MSSSYDYFGLGLEEAFGFEISLIEEAEEGFWRVNTPHGEACMKRFGRKVDVETATRAAVYVHERGFTMTPRLIPTSSGQLYVRSPMTDPVWYMALFGWIRGPEQEPASTLRDWREQADLDSDNYHRVAEELGQALGRFHESARGFHPWPDDREADFYIRNYRRVRTQVQLARSRSMQDARPEIKQLVESAIENCEPYLDDLVQRVEQSADLFRTVLAGARERQDVRHCDLHQGNFLISAEGLVIIDLAELEPGPRIQEARSLWSADRAPELAVRAYCEEVQLTKEEVELFPVICDPINGWRRFFDGYLSGDWTDEMLTGYHWHLSGYERKLEQVAEAAEILREVVG